MSQTGAAPQAGRAPSDGGSGYTTEARTPTQGGRSVYGSSSAYLASHRGRHLTAARAGVILDLVQAGCSVAGAQLRLGFGLRRIAAGVAC